MLTRRRFLHASAALGAAGTLPELAQAQGREPVTLEHEALRLREPMVLHPGSSLYACDVELLSPRACLVIPGRLYANGCLFDGNRTAIAEISWLFTEPALAYASFDDPIPGPPVSLVGCRVCDLSTVALRNPVLAERLESAPTLRRGP